MAATAVPFAALEPTPLGEAALGVLAVGLWLLATTTVRVMRDPNLARRQAEELSETVRRLRQRLKPQPQTIDVAPPLPEDDQSRRRRRCERLWVIRAGGNRFKEYHNAFAEAMVARYRIPANPAFDYRVIKSRTQYLDYDSYDSETNTFYEFKTRHDYLPYDRPSIKWIRLSGIVAQAWDQRMTLVNCGIEGDLVWVFQDPQVATEVRRYIGEWPVDRVLSENWDQ